MELINNAKNGIAEGFCIIKTSDRRTTQKGKSYLDLTLSDKGGEVNAKMWDYNPELHGEFASGDLIKVRATVDTWNNTQQLKIEKIRKAKDSDMINPEDFVTSAPISGTKIYEMIMQTVSSFKDAELKKIVLYILESIKPKLLICPAAMKMHHAYRGGVLYHTASILSAAKGVCDAYPFIDRDLVYAGVILHDTAKTTELEYDASGTPSGYTVKGNLLGHITLGVIEIENAAEKCGTNDELKMKLQHMVLSHHSVPEFGSPVPPMFLEAQVVAALDDLDATLFQMAQAMSQTGKGDITQRVWGLERKLYNQSGIKDDFKISPQF
ncbi:MAG: 3'-5' exoribonuclease YhaM family protein [Acutalibacteraceae bacterium]